ncbi:hypothetical protein B0H14DRAFT_3454910 [Mycena olivaceomarginata]|nr:hypothetical protein B0H14DRAFT_3454910 [Mycena olivaceomarginata]
MARPADIEPSTAFPPADLNTWNRTVEANNTISIQLTLAFKTARATAAGVGALDVGAPLQPLYAYSDLLNKIYLHSKELTDSTGPLPSSLVQCLAMQRMKDAEDEVAEKTRREQEKAKASAPVLGTLVMSKPVSFSSITDDDVEIPAVCLASLGQKIYLPMQWWNSSILRAANESLHSLPTTPVRVDQTAAEPSTTLSAKSTHLSKRKWLSQVPQFGKRGSFNFIVTIRTQSVTNLIWTPTELPRDEIKLEQLANQIYMEQERGGPL